MALGPDCDTAAASVADRKDAEPAATTPFAGHDEPAAIVEAAGEVEVENEAALVAVRTPGSATAALRRREKSLLGRRIGVVVGGLAGCAIAYYVLLPLALWLKTPASKVEKVRGKPAAERPFKPDAANHKPLPVIPEPAKEASPEPSRPSPPEEKEKAAPAAKPSDVTPPEGAPKDVAPPAAEPESPHPHPDSAP